MRKTKFEISVGSAYVEAYRVEVEGYVFGEWAAHKTYALGHGWRVSHVPTGFALDQLADDLSEVDARYLAQAIAGRVPVFTAKSPNDYDRELGHIIVATIGEFIGEGQVR